MVTEAVTLTMPVSTVRCHLLINLRLSQFPPCYRNAQPYITRINTFPTSAISSLSSYGFYLLLFSRARLNLVVVVVVVSPGGGWGDRRLVRLRFLPRPLHLLFRHREKKNWLFLYTVDPDMLF